VVIELGSYRDPDPDAGPRPPAARNRVLPLTVLAVVLLTVTAAAPPAAVPLRETARIAAAVTDAYTVSGDDVLVARRRGADAGLAAYSGDTGRRLWQAPVTPSTSFGIRRDGPTLFVGERVAGGGQPGVISTRVGTAALSMASGAVLWRHVGRVVPVEGATTALVVSDVPSFFGGGRRVQGAVLGIDVRTGRQLWSVPVPATAALQPLPGARARMLLIHEGGRMQTHDLSDGQVLATAQLPPANYAPDNPAVIGDTVLLRHPQRGGWALSAYDAGSLARRWSRAEPNVADTVRACGSLICVSARSGVRGLDPADGSSRWAQSGWRTVEPRGANLLVYGAAAGTAELIGLATAQTGALRLDLRRWRAVPGPADADVLLTRAADADGGTVIAMVDPAGGAIRILGTLTTGTGDCRAGKGLVVCRSGGGAIVGWRYR
jgi:hypothetical protein